MSKHTERKVKVYDAHVIEPPIVNPFPKKTQEEMITKLKEILGLFNVEDAETILNIANQKILEVFTYEIENYFEITFKLKFENEDSWTKFNLRRKYDRK